MPKWRYVDFQCETCGHTEERMIDMNEENVLTTQQCLAFVERTPEPGELAVVQVHDDGNSPVGVHCKGIMVKLDGAPLLKTIVRGNHDYNERERARLEKRRDEHFKKKGRDEKMDRMKMLDAKVRKQNGF